MKIRKKRLGMAQLKTCNSEQNKNTLRWITAAYVRKTDWKFLRESVYLFLCLCLCEIETVDVKSGRRKEKRSRN